MAQQSHSDPRYGMRKVQYLILAFCWIAGLFCGILFFSTSEKLFAAMAHRILFGSFSIASTLCAVALPFLFSVIWLYNPVLIMPLCFIKSFLISFVSIGILRHFGSAGWLFRDLLLFSDCITLPFLYLLWLRLLSGIKPAYKCITLFIAAVVFLLWSVDYRIISSLLACLIDF